VEKYGTAGQVTGENKARQIAKSADTHNT